MKRLILWDLDGTLIDTLEDLGAAVDYALKLRGLPAHTPAEYRRMVGHGVRNLVQQALEAAMRKAGEMVKPDGAAAEAAMRKAGNTAAEAAMWKAGEMVRPDGAAAEAAMRKAGGPGRLAEAEVDAALGDFKEYYTAHMDVFTRPYPGIVALLTELQGRGVRMAVASNKFQEGTEYLIREFFPEIDFVSILGNRPGFPLKPSPEIVEEVLAKSGVARADALLVGDSPTDMKTAANGGIDAIAVAWGYRTPEELAGNRIAGSVGELRGMLLRGCVILR